MYEPKQPEIVIPFLSSSQARQGSQTIDNKKSFYVIYPVLPHFALFLICWELEEIHDDINREANINEHFEIPHSGTELVEHKQEGSSKKSVYCKHIYKKTP
jgi:hypothetical protein